jgi:hypothetical protein
MYEVIRLKTLGLYLMFEKMGERHTSRHLSTLLGNSCISNNRNILGSEVLTAVVMMSCVPEDRPLQKYVTMEIYYTVSKAS